MSPVKAESLFWECMVVAYIFFLIQQVIKNKSPSLKPGIKLKILQMASCILYESGRTVSKHKMFASSRINFKAKTSAINLESVSFHDTQKYIDAA